MHLEPTFTSEIKVNLIDMMGGDHYVVAAARVSTEGSEALKYATQENNEGNSGLINYLIQHRHGTSFEHGGMIFYVHAPIFVWREWHRHRIGFSYNEESARYKPLEPCFYIPPRHRPMMKIDDWKPGRPKFAHCDSDVAYEVLCDGLKSSYSVVYSSTKRTSRQGLIQDWPGIACQWVSIRAVGLRATRVP